MDKVAREFKSLFREFGPARQIARGLGWIIVIMLTGMLCVIGFYGWAHGIGLL